MSHQIRHDRSVSNVTTLAAWMRISCTCGHWTSLYSSITRTTKNNVWEVQYRCVDKRSWIICTSYRSMVTFIRPPPEAMHASQPSLRIFANSSSNSCTNFTLDPSATSRPSVRTCTRIFLKPCSEHPFNRSCKQKKQPLPLPQYTYSTW